jgi:hypothetical protein
MFSGMQFRTEFGMQLHFRVAVVGERKMQRVEAQIAVSVSDLKKALPQ